MENRKAPLTPIWKLYRMNRPEYFSDSEKLYMKMKGMPKNDRALCRRKYYLRINKQRWLRKILLQEKLSWKKKSNLAPKFNSTSWSYWGVGIGKTDFWKHIPCLGANFLNGWGFVLWKTGWNKWKMGFCFSVAKKDLGNLRKVWCLQKINKYRKRNIQNILS